MLSRKLVGTLCLAAASCVLWASAAQAVDVFNLGGTYNPATGQWTGTASLEMVPVGNAGNAADPFNPDGYGNLGAVPYNYNIGKYDVTAGQYTAFLNAVAKTDTYGLYNSNMANAASMGADYVGCGISQTGTSGNYTYATTKNANFPVNYVSFWDSCRFTNWLQNGQPTGVNEGAGTTETGAYDLTNPTALANNTVTRTTGASWAVASENEWYKAAYYDPTKRGGAGYWMYPTRSDTAPGNSLALAATTPNEANYYGDWGTKNYGYMDPINFLTPVGMFAASPSAYSTFDQGGDVWQWNDTVALYSPARVLRGGSFYRDDNSLLSGICGEPHPASENEGLGFRVSQVPEPASVGLLGLGVIGVLVRRRGASR